VQQNPAFEENLVHSQGLRFATTVPGHPEQQALWRIERIPGEPLKKRTPYWVLQVPPAIINGHTPIFTAEGRAMMAAIFRITNPKSQPGPRQMQLSAVQSE
jgi:hypothetical protein